MIRHHLLILSIFRTQKIASMDFSDVVKELASKDPRVKLVRLKVPEDLEVLRGLVRESNLVVVASSDPEANKVVARLSLEAGKLVNNATDARRGNVIVPFKATLYGGIHVAVTSLGEAGVAARRVLERIVETLARDVELETLYKVMSKVKRRLKREIKDPKARIKLYFAIANDELFRESQIRR